MQRIYGAWINRPWIGGQITKMHDYIFYSIAAILYFIIYLDLRRSEKNRKRHSTFLSAPIPIIGSFSDGVGFACA
jgi:hypothetical protein